MHNIHNGKWCNLFHWTQKLHQLHYIIKRTKCSRWLSSSEGGKKRIRGKKRVKILCIGCQGHGNLSKRMRTISSRMRLLSLGYRYSKRPSRLFLHVSITFDMRWRVSTSKSFALCTTLNREADALRCSFRSPGGWGVRTGKHDNGYTSAGLWALQWPSCLLTLLSLSYKSYPERFIGLTCQAVPVVFGGWSCSTDKRHGDKFCICWVTTAYTRICYTAGQFT